MVGLICMYFIGKYFYRLAKEYRQSLWLITPLGILSYYLGSYYLGGMVMYYFTDDFNFDGGDILMHFPKLGVLKMPFGIAVAVVFHYVLEYQWRKSEAKFEDEIEDIGKNPGG